MLCRILQSGDTQYQINNIIFALSECQVYLALRHTNWGHCKLKVIQFKFHQMQVFEERRKPEEYPGENLSEQRREPTTLNPHMTLSLEIERRSYCWKARSRGRGKGGRAPPEIFRFELNSTTKMGFCLLKWTVVSGSYSFQVLSIIVRLCTDVLLCSLELFKGTKSYFCSAKNNQQL